MKLLHEDKELFREVIGSTAEEMGQAVPVAIKMRKFLNYYRRS